MELIMKTSNNYVGLNTAINLIQNKNWIFRQNLSKTEFKVKRGEHSSEYFNLKKKTAAELKAMLPALKAQLKIKL